MAKPVGYQLTKSQFKSKRKKGRIPSGKLTARQYDRYFRNSPPAPPKPPEDDRVEIPQETKPRWGVFRHNFW